MEIEHFSHEHRLTLKEEEKKEGANEVCCSACRHPIDGPAYNCSLCNFFLHKQCAKLSREILHPFHSTHPLTLCNYNPYKPGSCLCDACRKICHGFVYHCAKCKFDLCLECASVTPAIKYEGHHHLLSFFEKLHGNKHKCNACYSLCDANVIRCVPCQFNFHVHCFPSLPHTITHKCHSCLLTLTDPLTFLTRTGDSIEFYCGACKTKDNPKHSVYYCADCNYAAHVECVISEVLPSLVLKIDAAARTEETILAKLDEEIKKLRAEVDPALAKLTEDIEKLRAEVDPALAKLNEEIQKLRAEVNLTPAKFDEEIEKLRAEVNLIPAKLDQEITQLHDEVKAMKEKLESLDQIERARHGASDIPKVTCLTMIQDWWSGKKLI